MSETRVRRIRLDNGLWSDLGVLAMLERSNISAMVREILVKAVKARLRRKLESMPVTNTIEGRFTVKLPELVLVNGQSTIQG
jgi:hypothetical protein